MKFKASVAGGFFVVRCRVARYAFNKKTRKRVTRNTKRLYTFYMTKEQQEDPGLAEVLGKGYAHLQHGIDRVIAWGFSKMNDLEGEEPTEKEIMNPHLRTAANIGRKAVSFVCKAGNAYFKTYEDLKRK